MKLKIKEKKHEVRGNLGKLSPESIDRYVNTRVHSLKDVKKELKEVYLLLNQLLGDRDASN